MRKLDLDLTIVGSVSILVMLLWSNLSASKDWSIGVLLLLGVFLCSYNVFILLKRDSETRLVFIIHVYLVYILGACIFSLMLIEETSLRTAVLYFLGHMLLPIFSYLLFPRIEVDKQRKLKLIVFVLSIVVLGFGFMLSLTILI